MTTAIIFLVGFAWFLFFTRKTEGQKVADELKNTNKMLVSSMKQNNSPRYTAHGTRIY